MDMEQGVFVNRKILYIKPDLYVIMDEMYTGGAHTYEQYWHFSERGELSLGAVSYTHLDVYKRQPGSGRILQLPDRARGVHHPHAFSLPLHE